MTSEIIIFKTQDGKTDISVKVEDGTVWLTQGQMVELFNTTKQNISLHIKNIFDEGEQDKDSVVKEYLTTAADGKNYNTKYYNLDVIISVGYRVKSTIGTQFRIWATQVLKEYMVKGFAMNDRMLKEVGGGGYWQELLTRIRDIRSSEKVFYRQILDIYATSLDYDKNAAESIKFFKVVQNKMHYAAHGHTAAEIEFMRADGNKPFAGLKSFDGERPRASDMTVAKNYLDEEELNVLNRITTAYLEFAELQATLHNPMYMKDWIIKLDDFIKMTGREILQSAGTISKLEADNKALAEYAVYKERTKDEFSQVEKDFLENLKTTQKQIESQVKGKK
jgi:hypothetical protein